jgi:hypothetical protein
MCSVRAYITYIIRNNKGIKIRKKMYSVMKQNVLVLQLTEHKRALEKTWKFISQYAELWHDALFMCML